VGTFYLKPDSLRLGAHVANAGYVVAVQAAPRLPFHGALPRRYGVESEYRF
jgi:hypothetical protein